MLASNAGPDHWPPDDLLVIEGEKGVFGKIKIEHPKYSEYEDDVVELVERFIDDRTLIVIPELSGSKSIEEKIRKLLDESGKHCIVVGGSYYRDLPQAYSDPINGKPTTLYPPMGTWKLSGCRDLTRYGPGP